jgi:hypothetical protein
MGEAVDRLEQQVALAKTVVVPRHMRHTKSGLQDVQTYTYQRGGKQDLGGALKGLVRKVGRFYGIGETYAEPNSPWDHTDNGMTEHWTISGEHGEIVKPKGSEVYQVHGPHPDPRTRALHPNENLLISTHKDLVDAKKALAKHQDRLVNQGFPGRPVKKYKSKAEWQRSMGKTLARAAMAESTPEDQIDWVELSEKTAMYSTTHSPLGKPGGPGLFKTKNLQLPAYIQHIAKALMRDHGFTMSHAIAAAVNRVKKWAAGGGGVSPEVRAAAAKAVAEWEAAKARARATPNKK